MNDPDFLYVLKNPMFTSLYKTLSTNGIFSSKTVPSEEVIIILS